MTDSSPLIAPVITSVTGPVVQALTGALSELDPYAVLGLEPEFVSDFINEYYRTTSGQQSAFSGAINHVRNGNATMTDGYGPELVTNGGFDGSIDGWTAEANSDVSYDDGKIRLTVANSANAGAYQELTTESGKTYIVTALLVDIDSHSFATVRVGTSGGSGNLLSSTVAEGAIQLSFTATSSTSYITLRPNSTTNGNYAVYDNVSVRAMPVIKWAPHNLMPYSEDFNNAAWVKRGTATVTPNDTTAPDGTLTADLLTRIGEGQNDVYQILSLSNPAGTPYEVGFFVKRVSTSGIAFIQSPQSILNGRWRLDLSLLSDSWELINKDHPAITVDYEFSGYPNGGVLIRSTTATELSFHIWGAHYYRSDLGGMVDNPDQPLSRASYVPTTSSDKYLPRIGHHVYNGSAWANEGVLAESEDRTNLVPYSDFSSDWNEVRSTLTANQAVSPDGTQSAAEIVEDALTDPHYINDAITATASAQYTLSVYVKQGSGNRSALLRTSSEGSDDYIIFDFATETITETGSGTSNATSQSVGNGWYRIAFTYTQSGDTSSGILIGLSNSTTPSNSLPSYTGDGTSSIFIYGAQFEEGSTPSSFCPTNGQQCTREAESFTIPSANLPWPSPVYVGDEEVINGTFNTNISGWNTRDTGVATFDSGSLKIERTGVGTNSGVAFVYQSITGLTVGKLYRASADIFFDSADGEINPNFEAELALDQTAKLESTSSHRSVLGYDTVENISFIFIATSTTHELGLSARGAATGFVNYDNVSVREIDPLSVSIATEGRVSYTDDGTNLQASMVNWGGATGYIRHQLRTDGANTGQIRVWQNDSDGTSDTAESDGDAYEEGILRSFDMAGRHGSTFINGALNGVAFTENTTPTELYDLSATDLSLAYDYMGTIGTFRIWNKDITDDGLVEATNPSLEPSLSLTFEGTGTNSFVVNDWSE